jgi:hypothetical protein
LKEEDSSLTQFVHQQSIASSDDLLLTEEDYNLHGQNFEDDSSLSWGLFGVVELIYLFVAAIYFFVTPVSIRCYGETV